MCVPPPAKVDSNDDHSLVGCECHQVLAELIHRLSQPLTGLSCALDLACKRSRNRSWDRAEFRRAREQVESLASLTTSIRALIEAAQPSATEETSELTERLAELAEEVEPVAAANGVGLSIDVQSPLRIKLESVQLRQALFYLLDFSIHVSAKGTEIRIHRCESDQKTVLTIELMPSRKGWFRPDVSHAGKGANLDNLKPRVRLAIARKIFENAGATFQARYSAGRLLMTFDFQQLVSEHIEPVPSSLRRPA